MSVVGIDQSYTGFGYSVNGAALRRNFPNKGNDVERLALIRKWFTNWLKLTNHEAGIDLVVMEGYAPGAKFGREMAGELGGVVKLAVWDVVGKPPLVVPPTSLKKFVMGGGAKKNQMLLGVYKQWGQEFSDDNQADAYALEKFGLAYLYLEQHDESAFRGPKYQIEAIKAVRKPK